MSYRVVIDTARPALRNLMRNANPAAVNKVVAQSALRLTRDRFAQVATYMRNPWGKPAQFWKRMYRATRAESTSTSASVVVPREVALHYYGGRVRPTGGRKFLTIPAVAQAYRRSARTFRDLVFMIVNGRPALAKVKKVAYTAEFSYGGDDARSRSGKPRKGSKRRVKTGTVDKPTVFYWLVRGVRMKPNLNVIPTAVQYQSGISRDVLDYLTRGVPHRLPPIT